MIQKPVKSECWAGVESHGSINPKKTKKKIIRNSITRRIMGQAGEFETRGNFAQSSLKRDSFSTQVILENQKRGMNIYSSDEKKRRSNKRREDTSFLGELLG